MEYELLCTPWNMAIFDLIVYERYRLHYGMGLRPPPAGEFITWLDKKP